MSALAGTTVIAKIVPTDTADTYATHDDKYGAGGLQTDVADSTARLAISTDRRKKGMLVYQVDEQNYYKLENDLTTWTNKGNLSLEWIKYTIPYTSLAAADLVANATVVTLPIKAFVHQVIHKHSTQFSGGLVSAASVTIGIVGTESKYGDTLIVSSSVSNTALNQKTINSLADFGATTTVKAFLTTVGDNTDQLTQGSLDVWILYSVIA